MIDCEKVYVVEEEEVVDYNRYCEIWLFATEDIARSFMKKRLARKNEEYKFYEDGSVEINVEGSFSWTLNIGFNDNTYDIWTYSKEVM